MNTVFAHAAHWLPQVAMLAPLPILAIVVLIGRLRERDRPEDDPGAGS